MDIDYSADTVQMVNDAYRENLPSIVEEDDRWEEPNVETRRFLCFL